MYTNNYIIAVKLYMCTDTLIIWCYAKPQAHMLLGLQKSTMWVQKIADFSVFAVSLLNNLITIYTTATKSSSLLQNLMDFLLQLTEMG